MDPLADDEEVLSVKREVNGPDHGIAQVVSVFHLKRQLQRTVAENCILALVSHAASIKDHRI